MVVDRGARGIESGSSEVSSDEDSASGGRAERGGTGGSGLGCGGEMVAVRSGVMEGCAGSGELFLDRVSEGGSGSEGAGSDSGKPGSESDVTCSESEIGSRSDTGPVTGSGERFCSRLE